MAEVDFAKVANRKPNKLHESFASWIKENTDVTVSPKAIQTVLQLHPHFRTSDVYTQTRDAVRSERGQADQERKARAEAKIKARIEKSRQEQAVLEARLRGEAPARKPRGSAKSDESPKPAKRGRSRAARGADAAEGKVTQLRGRRSSRPAAQAAPVPADDPF